MQVTRVTFRKESAVPGEVTPASTSAPVHPLPSRRLTKAVSDAISMWRPQIIQESALPHSLLEIPTEFALLLHPL